MWVRIVDRLWDSLARNRSLDQVHFSIGQSTFAPWDGGLAAERASEREKGFHGLPTWHTR